MNRGRQGSEGHSETKVSTVRARMLSRRVKRPPFSWVAGLVAALAVGALGWQFAAANPQEWKATTQLLVVPQATIDSDEVPGYWETLSTGQVSATAAGIIGEPQYLDETRAELGLAEDDSITATVAVAPGTLLIEVTVQATERDTAEQVADELPQQSLAEVNDQLEPFEVSALGGATDTAERTGISSLQFAAAVALAALIAGLAVQQVVQQLAAVRRRSSR